MSDMHVSTHTYLRRLHFHLLPQTEYSQGTLHLALKAEMGAESALLGEHVAHLLFQRLHPVLECIAGLDGRVARIINLPLEIIEVPRPLRVLKLFISLQSSGLKAWAGAEAAPNGWMYGWVIPTYLPTYVHSYTYRDIHTYIHTYIRSYS